MLHKSIVLAAAFAAMAAAIPVHLAPQRLSECPENENYNGRECVCDRGFERSREGGCVEPPITVRCGRNEVPNPRGGCDCDRGFDMTREGCVKPTTAVRCGRNEVPDSRGGCKCDRGFDMTREGCVEPTTAVRCGRNEVPDTRGGCKCDRGFDMTREGCKPSDDDDDDDDAPLKNMRGDSWCEKKKDKNARICAKQNKRGAFRYRDEWCVKMCASRD
jgi:hypothetical protein